MYVIGIHTPSDIFWCRGHILGEYKSCLKNKILSLAHAEAPPSVSGPHYRHGLIGRALLNHYISAEKYSVFNTWKLSKKWPLG